MWAVILEVDMRAVPPQTDDPAIEPLAAATAELAEAWASMVWLSSTDAELHRTRREIARWAYATNQSFVEAFDRCTVSEEIRVIIEGLAGCVPRHLDDDGRALVAAVTDNAQALAAAARAATTRVTGVPAQR
jgi:hypothetical protein